MEIRLAQQHELPILEKLARAIWPSTYAEIISAEQIEFMLTWMYSTAKLQEQYLQGHEFFLLSENGKDLGFLALEWMHSEEHPALSLIKINKLYVLPQLQKKGFGSALIQKAITRAQQTNAIKLILQVNKANSAKIFYQKLGFRIQQEAVFDIGNGFVMDDYIMELSV
ncbi:MAG: N-acetyltransferase family protein [Flavobacteriales bacterium]